MKILSQPIPKTRAAVLVFIFGLFFTPAFGQVTITNIPTLGGGYAAATALNNLGQMVGFSLTTGNAAQHAFLFGDGVLCDLGTLGGSFSLASGINATGQIIGEASTLNDAEDHAFLVSGGTMTDLGTLGGTESSSVAINNSGQVTGSANLQGDAQQRAFLWTGGAMISLGTLGGSFSVPVGLNNPGQVAGNSFTTNDAVQHAFLYSSNVMYDLGAVDAPYSSAAAINDSGQVVGESQTNSDTHAFLFSNGVMTDLGTFGGVFSSAYAINNSGQVIGDATTANEAEYHGFLYQNGAMIDLGTLGGQFSSAAALNNRGQVVGEADNANHVSFPFLWQNGVMVDLNSVLPPNSGWVLQSASLINDAGQIVGYGSYNGSPSWYLLTVNFNRPPVADAGADQTVECSTAVVLDGSHSSDPDRDPLTFQWSEGGTVLGSGSTLSVQLSLGTHLISLTVTDSGNLSSQSTVTVNVKDTTAPILLCPTLKAASADVNCVAAVPDVTVLVPAADNCTDAASLVRSQSPAAGTLVGVGSHPIILRVTDASGNAGSCPILFNVVDTTPPSVVCPAPVTATADATGKAALPDFTVGANAADNCTPAAQVLKSQTPVAGTLLGPGSYVVTVTATDAAGNANSCTTSFAVTDNTPPVVSCPAPVTAPADAHCQSAVPDLLAGLSASDNCTPASQLAKAQTPPAGTLVGLGAHPITVTVTDAAGNASSCATTLTVTDSTPPVVVCPASSTAPANGQCQGVVPDLLASLSASDNCTPASQLAKTQNPPAGTVVGIGVHPITLTVTDAAGNVSSCATTFTVATATPPVVRCPSSVTAQADQNCQAAVPDLLSKLHVSVSCKSADQFVKTQNPPAGTLVGLGAHPITITVTDAVGNVSSCATTFTVTDSTPPVVSCPAPITVSPDANGQAAVPDLLAGLNVSDNCTPADQLVKTQNPPAGALLGSGTHHIKVTVTDASGNTTACSTGFKVR